MKNVLFLFLIVICAIKIQAQSVQTPAGAVVAASAGVPDTTIRSFKFITLSEATKVLEQPCYLKDSVWKFEGGIWKFNCDYQTKTKDSLTKMPYRLFFSFENYKLETEADRFFDLMKTENSKSATLLNTEMLGDESFVTKDVLKNPFVMIRKGRKIFKFKVYQVTSESSLKQLIALAKSVIAFTD